MKKYLALLCILILAFVFQGYRMYHSMQASFETDVEQAVDRAFSEAKLTNVKQSFYFTGPQSYHVIEGEDDSGTKLYVFVPDASDAEVKRVETDKGYSQQQVEDMVDSQSNEVIRIVPGLLNDRFVWEAVHKLNGSNAWQYDYYDFYNGKFIKSIKLTS